MSYISRSQAKRILHNLDRFQVIVLDFDRIDVIGQAFADEVFRVWQSHNPNVRIDYINVHENVEFMIKRALASKLSCSLSTLYVRNLTMNRIYDKYNNLYPKFL